VRSGGAAGLFVLAGLPPGTDEAAVVRAAAARGVGVDGLALHRYAAADDAALLLGYGNLAEPAIARGIRLLADAVAEVRAGA
jgi:GntR family transcriptional regulator/MocR family aminotransferase